VSLHARTTRRNIDAASAGQRPVPTESLAFPIPRLCRRHVITKEHKVIESSKQFQNCGGQQEGTASPVFMMPTLIEGISKSRQHIHFQR
jgi:hypothetical protein